MGPNLGPGAAGFGGHVWYCGLGSPQWGQRVMRWRAPWQTQSLGLHGISAYNSRWSVQMEHAVAGGWQYLRTDGSVRVGEVWRARVPAGVHTVSWCHPMSCSWLGDSCTLGVGLTVGGGPHCVWVCGACWMIIAFLSAIACRSSMQRILWNGMVYARVCCVERCRCFGRLLL